MPGGEEGLEAHLRSLLDATVRLSFALGIVNIWSHPATDIACMYHRLRDRYGDRLLVGIGVGHAPIVDAGQAGRYRAPLRSITAYLDVLDAPPHAIPADRRFIAAFSPKMLELARDRTRGAVPYLTTPEHTRWARSILGPGAMLVAEQHVIVERDPGVARRIARQYLATYLGLPNYLNNFRRMGLSDEDFRNGGSDHMVDVLVAWGGVDAGIVRAREHLDAGADHVGIQILTEGKAGFPAEGWRTLASVLGDLR